VNFVVDTCVWSLALRRRSPDAGSPHLRTLVSRIEAGDGVFVVGPIIQELLDGVRSESDFRTVLGALSSIPLLEVQRETYVAAARLSNHCRRHGVHAEAVDFLIAAACMEHGMPLLTADADFERIAANSKLALVPVGAR